MEAIHQEFQDLVKDFLEKHPNGVRELAQASGLSYSSIHRWARGKNFPHPVMCPPIIK